MKKYVSPVLVCLAVGGAACGPPAIDASKVQQLAVTATGPKTFCPMQKTALGVQAKMVDGKLRATNAKDRSDTFNANELTWTVAPAVGQMKSETTDVFFTSGEDVSALLDKDVTLTVTMKKNTAVSGTIELGPDFTCPQIAVWSARDGAWGEEGESGYTGQLGQMGGPGVRGGDGSPGANAGPVDVAIKLVETPKRGKVAAVRVSRGGDIATYFVDPAKGSLVISNRGGAGGGGGNGGYGGDGGFPKNECSSGLAGGNGGDGGNGANGGEGGAVTVRFDASHPELRNLVKIDNAGGAGGAPGGGGAGGIGSMGDRPTTKTCKPPDGAFGHEGHPSSRGGNNGRNGPAPQFVAEAGDRLFPDNQYASRRTAEGNVASVKPGPKARRKGAPASASASASSVAGPEPEPEPQIEPPAGASGAGGVSVTAFKLAITDPTSNVKKVEMKSDGTVLIDDKPGAKLRKDQLLDLQGKPFASVGVDGAVSIDGVPTVHITYAGEDLYLAKKVKFWVKDDGAVMVTTAGKAELTMGKLEGAVGKSKRAVEFVLLVAAMQPRLVNEAVSASPTPPRTKSASAKKKKNR